MNCGCYYCRNYGEDCPERHPKEEITKAKISKGGWFYWGKKIKEAKGRYINLCKYCIDSMMDDWDWIDEPEGNLQTEFGIKC